ncbi:DUF4373 domain-containing protein [Flavobacterium psychrophilum]|uniref:DUF4373 domain-containing protein n=1 Tax=Flavobacterium psychrophilum TaxID=96345 RepID=UPI000B7C250E|nr:DUF4373 domain-containing protein [Flavobacterium psychrophilum]SNA84042.1 hypothetical protein FI070_440008 [Flavobacterium psychrophilum]
MARPKRENAEYFSHDANMRNDPKIKALRKKFKEGYSVYNMFLEYLTDCRFFEVEMTDLEYEIMSGDFDIETEFLIDILNYCVKIGLLNKTENVFFSNGLKKRLQPVLDKRNKAKASFLSQFATETDKKEEKVQKSLVSVTETTQSKVKESKVKESKVYKKEIESIDSRKLKFSHTLEPFLKTYGKDLLNEFYKYWTEQNVSNSKFRRELQKTWDVGRRLETWAKNDKNFKKPENGNPNSGPGISGQNRNR